MIETYISGPFFTNTYLVIEETDAVIVDPGLGFFKYADEINKKYKVRGILLTHGHIDHIDSIGFFKCPIYINKDEKEFLYDESLALYPLTRTHRSFDVNKLDLHFINDKDVVTINNMVFTAISTPGHTKGSMCYKYKNKLFSGDTLFNCSQGRTDFPTGNDKQMRESLNKIIKLCSDNTVVYPGHDDKTNIKFERQNNPYVIQALK